METAFEKIQEVFTAALALDAAARPAFLDGACENDLNLRHEVESLLRCVDSPMMKRLEKPAFGVGVRVSIEAALTCHQPASSNVPSAMSPETLPDVPARIGKYSITSELGRGGQATVYRAVHPTLETEVVVKVLHTQNAARMLADEARTLASLDHPNIARVFDLDLYNGRPFLVMEYVRGRNLKQYASSRPLPALEAATLVAQAARGLGAAHRAGVIHLDVKPLNLLVSDSGSVKVIDFGIAKLRGVWREDPAGQISGTLLYLAPEQARRFVDGPIEMDPRTDVFALGAVLFFLITGKDAYGDVPEASLLETLANASFNQGPLRQAGVPAQLRAICLKAMSADPARRFADGDEMAAALERFARPTRRRIWAGLILGIVLLVAAIFSAYHLRNPVNGNIPLSVEIDVRRGGTWTPLESAGPMVDGDEVRLHANIPSGFFASLVGQDAVGKVTELADLTADNNDRELRFPAEGKAVPLTPPSGTEVIVLLVRQGAAVNVEELRTHWPTPGAWPELPPAAIVRQRGDQIEVLHDRRGLGRPVDASDPAEEARKRLATLREGLRLKSENIAAVVFSHASLDHK